MGLPDIGTIALMAALALCVYGTVVPHLGVRANNWNLIRSAQNASILTFFCGAQALTANREDHCHTPKHSDRCFRGNSMIQTAFGHMGLLC